MQEQSPRNVIIAEDFDTRGVNKSDLEPLDYFVALTKRVVNAEREIGTLRVRCYNLEVEVGMVKEQNERIKKTMEWLLEAQEDVCSGRAEDATEAVEEQRPRRIQEEEEEIRTGKEDDKDSN